MSESLWEYRVYVRAATGEWELHQTVAADEKPGVILLRERREHPEVEFRLARRTLLEEWVDE